MMRVPPQFHYLIFNFLRIELHDFSRLSASSLMTQDTSLKKVIYFLKKNFIILFILIRLFQLYNLYCGFNRMSLGLSLIRVFTYLSLIIFYIFVFFYLFSVSEHYFFVQKIIQPRDKTLARKCVCVYIYI
jgi:fumarate reductase subunit D